MATSIRIWGWKLGLVSLVAGCNAIATFGDCSLAQNVTLDGTLGSAQTLTGPGYVIRQENGQTVGSNLFHSFGKFSLNQGESANFESAANIRNILSRVTGGDRSLIDGEIFTQSSNVNLFLINPSGITFGPNATLDVGGVNRSSFVATTVDALLWPNGGQFSATNPGGASSLLTLVGDPSGFLSSLRQPQSIESVNSNLTNSDSNGTPYDGQSLLLLGGDVQLNGTRLQSSGGRVELGGSSGAGTVGLSIDGNNLSLNFPDSLARSDVSLTNGATVDVAAGDGGSIAVTARNLDVSGGSLIAAGIASGLGSVNSKAGDITLDATGAITVRQSPSRIDNRVNPNATGNSGNINITAGSLSVTDGAQLSSSTYGQGNAGSVTINASDTVSFDGVDSNGNPSAAFTTVEAGGVGKGGDINITAKSLSLTNGGGLNTFIRGASEADFGGNGNAGNVTLNISDAVTIAGVSNNGTRSGIFSDVGTGAAGTGGNLTIDTGRLSIRDGAQVLADTSGEGNTGNLLVQARDSVEVVGAGSFLSADVNSGASGTGGNLTIDTGRLSVSDGAQVSASTSGVGNAGDLTVRARDLVELSRGGSLIAQVNSGAQGNGGNLTIETERLSALSGSFVAASTFGAGNAGTLSVRAFDIQLSGTAANNNTPSGLFAEVGAQRATGAGGNLTIEAGRLSLSDGAQIRVDTFGAGSAGTLSVRAADAVELSGNSGLSAQVNSGASGTGGNLTIVTGRLSVSDGADVVVDTSGEGNAGSLLVQARDSVEVVGAGSFLSADVLSNAIGTGGNVTIDTGSLSIRDGAYVTADTYGEGNAGSLLVQARDSVEVVGAGSFLSADVIQGARGDGGNLTTETGKLIVRNGAQVSASTYGKGNAGDLTINASDSISLSGEGSGLFAQAAPTATGKGGSLNIQTGSLQLSDRAQISAATAFGEGGNINLNIDDTLVMRNNSLISAEALNNANGGNITINAPDGFVVAFPNQNNDIVANAAQGKGGNINITAESIFGIEERPLNRVTNDINASSEFGLQGNISINNPDVDPEQGLVELPAELADASNQIASSNCPADGENRFTVTGRGGLPPNPREPLNGEAILTNWATLEGVGSREQGAGSRENTSTNSTSSAPTQIVEATGWVVNDKGEVVLTAAAPTATLDIPWLPESGCHASKPAS